MDLPDVTYITVHQYIEHSIQQREIAISTEYPVLVTINERPLLTIACSGNNIVDLVTGHLAAEGMITSKDDIQRLHFDESLMVAEVSIKPSEKVNTILSSTPSLATCGGGSKRNLPSRDHVHSSLPDVKAGIINHCMDTFLHQSSLHQATHGVHSSAMLDLDGNQVVFCDEIGRHNAIDKVIGYAVNNNIPLHDKMVLSTGRISSEIVMKLILSGIPVFISRASPTSFCVDLVKEYNMICICRARNNGFTIINGHEQILL